MFQLEFLKKNRDFDHFTAKFSSKIRCKIKVLSFYLKWISKRQKTKNFNTNLMQLVLGRYDY